MNAKQRAPHPTVLPVLKLSAVPRNSNVQRRMIAKQPASGAANHARHHVSRQTQS